MSLNHGIIAFDYILLLTLYVCVFKKKIISERSKTFPCRTCPKEFARRWNRERHETACAAKNSIKAKHSGVQGNCNWCGHNKSLLPGKPLCSTCAEKGRECVNCHRPMPERFFGERVGEQLVKWDYPG